MVDKKSASRTASRRGVRPPTLKDISDRLTTSTAPMALSEITASTNLPSANPPSSESRLKLPPSAVVRANLTPSPSPPARLRTLRNDENERVDLPKSDKEGGNNKVEVAKALSRQSSTTTLKNSEISGIPTSESFNSSNSLALSMDEGFGSPTPSRPGVALVKDDKAEDSPIKPIGAYKPKAIEELRTKARASLGHGFPETPSRSKDDVPSIIVQRSTPGQSPSKGTESGVHSGVSSPAIPSSPRSIANGLPLEHSWSLLYDSKTYKQPPDVFAERRKHMNDWEAGMLPIGTFDTIQSFCRHFNNVRLPSKLLNGANYHMFKDGIRPSWEDPANTRGGKWVLFVRSGKDNYIDAVWANLVLALVGEQLDPDNNVTGIVVSSRPKMDRVQIWTRIKDDVAAINGLGSRILETIGLDQQEMQYISLDFQAHEGTIPRGKFMRVDNANNARSVSVTGSTPPPSGNTSRMASPLPGASPVGTPSALPTWSPTPHSPMAPSSPRQSSAALPLSRSRIGAGGNAFSGPLGTARRAFSTTVE